MQAPADFLSVSLLTPAGYQSGSCGYCKDPTTGERTPDTNGSYYLISKKISVDHYQELVDRGFRRSGTLFYKPDLKRQCCPHYTIRLPVEHFKPSSNQRSAVNKWNRFILGDDYIKEAAKMHPKSREEKKKAQNSFDLLEAVHAAEYSGLKTPPEPAHRFEVTLEEDKMTTEKFRLFKDYQQHVHHEKDHEISSASFKRFLCESPLIRTSIEVDGKTQKLGSYHQCYRLDGRLIAMGVLDLLPHCVSAVYFIYHRDFEKYSFGKISALREAALAREGNYSFYYMGFFIPSCQKMKYKGEFKTQFVLDPETYEWNPLDDDLWHLMDRQHYVSPSRERKKKDGEDQDMSTLMSAQDVSSASEDGQSLLVTGMSGVTSLDQLEKDIDLDKVTVFLKPSTLTTMDNIQSWKDGNIRNSHSLNGIVAELAACVGPKIAKVMWVALNGQSFEILD